MDGVIEVSKALATPIATIIAAIFVYNYSMNNHKKTLLNELDSKSEWRKTLFEIAGKDKITLDDIFKIRACLRFDYKNYANNTFDKKTKDIIKYCDDMKQKYDDNYNCESKILFKIDREKARIYSRYLLANHWEVLQLSDKEYKKYRICRGDPLDQINDYKELKWYQKEQELERKTNKLISNLEKRHPK